MEKKVHTTFKHFDFFMIRSSIFENSIFEKIIEDENLTIYSILSELERASKKEIFLEAIAISSPSLYQSIINYEERSPKRKKQILKSVVNYLKRMSYRSTPYGLMSSIGYGEFENNKQAQKDSYYKDIEIDSKWKFEYIKRTLNTPDYFKKLFIMLNPSAVVKDNILILTVLPPLTEIRNSNITFKLDDLLFFILEKSKDMISVQELALLIKVSFNLEERIIHKMISDLIQYGLFVVKLDYSLSPFENVDELNDLLNDYRKMELGDGLSTLNKINSFGNLEATNSNLIKVDLYKNNEFYLDTRIGTEITEVANVLYKISDRDRTLLQIDTYKTEFIKKYGSDNEVPLLKLLDPDEGLGFPYTYPNIEYKNEREDYLVNLIHESNINNTIEVVLDELKVERLAVKKKKANHPNSLELYIELIKVEKEDYLMALGPNVGSRGAGKSFARFSKYKEIEKFNKMYKKIIERTDENIIYADVSFIPSNLKSANVIGKETIFEYQIPINYINNIQKIIELDDILVGVSENSLYLKSSKLKKQIVPIKNHMVNHSSFPPLVRFLCEMEYEGQNNWTPFNWGSLEKLNFLPRIKYKNTIIYKARWLLNLEMLSIYTDDFNLFYEKFNYWIIKNNLPRYVNIGKVSMRLLYDLNNTYDIKEIYKILKSTNGNNKIIIEEAIENFNEELSVFKKEIVVPMYSYEKYKTTVSERFLNSNPCNENLYLPGSEWSSIKFYISNRAQDSFIKEFIQKVTSLLIQKGLITEWFFIRYSDPKNHIRFRFKKPSNQRDNESLDVVLQMINKYRKASPIKVNNLIIDTYTPEVNRYGNDKTFTYLEPFFRKDSEMVVHFLTENNYLFNKIDFAVFSIIDMINNFSLSLNIIIEWLDRVINYKIYLQDFKNKRTFYMNHVEWDGENNIIKITNIPKSLDEGLRSRKIDLNRFRDAIEQNGFDRYKILTDLMHMNINRIMGTDPQKELMILGITRHVLKEIERKRTLNDK